MSCTIFTIIKTYFRCCVTRDTPATPTTDDGKSDNSAPFILSYASDGEQSPFTFDDLTRSRGSSASSSSSSINEYEHQYQSSYVYNKRQHIHPFGGMAPYIRD
jgi:hypothetical protein